MPAEKVINSVETIEAEVEKTLEAARSRANEIALKAREEASRILSAELSLDEVKREGEQILSQAREQASQEIEGAKKQAAAIRTSAGKKTGHITERIVNIITGADSK